MLQRFHSCGVQGVRRSESGSDARLPGGLVPILGSGTDEGQDGRAVGTVHELTHGWQQQPASEIAAGAEDEQGLDCLRHSDISPQGSQNTWTSLRHQ
jgi:hypothetical protein